jgi:hypothetical protein
MTSTLNSSIATRRIPGIAGIPCCAAVAKRQGLKRSALSMEIRVRLAFGGTGFGYPSNGHSWDLGTSNIREGRHMA